MGKHNKWRRSRYKNLQIKLDPPAPATNGHSAELGEEQVFQNTILGSPNALNENYAPSEMLERGQLEEPKAPSFLEMMRSRTEMQRSRSPGGGQQKLREPYRGDAEWTKREHRKRARDNREENGSVMSDFFAKGPKRKRTESAPVWLNLDILTRAEDPSTYASTLNFPQSSSSSKMTGDGIEGDESEWGRLDKSSGDEEDEGEVKELQEIEEAIKTNVEDSLFPGEIDSPTNPMPTPTSQDPQDPNSFEGEDPDDIKQELWRDRQLIALVGKEIKRMEAKHGVKLDKVIAARLTGMLALINFFTKSNPEITWTEASMLAAKAGGRGVSFARNLRRWILAYAQGNCTYQSLPHTQYTVLDTTLLHNEDLSQRIQHHLQTLGPHFNAQDVVNFVASPIMQACIGTSRKKISLKTAQRWLTEHYRYGQTAKGMYIDGHERSDVVKYRKEFLVRMEEYASQMVTFDVVNKDITMTYPTLVDDERLIILVTHDESTFYENDHKCQRWIPRDEKPVPQPKGEGVSSMASDFLSPNFGRLMVDNTENREARVLFRAGKNQDGYFDNNHLLDQVEKAIQIFEKKCPGAQALFLFDNATTHRKRAPDALSATKMSKDSAPWPADKPRMRDAVLPNGLPQSLYWPEDHLEYPGYFKGMEQILRERGLFCEGLRAQCTKRFLDCEDRTDCCCRRILFNQPDFVEAKSALEELIENYGHLCDFYPKFHCELNFIEQYWGAAKYRYRKLEPVKGIEAIEQNVKACLDDVPLVQMQRYWIRSLRFMDAYRKGLNGAQAVWANRRYHGHRCLPAGIMETLLSNNIQ